MFYNLLIIICKLILLGLASEALTELIVDSKISAKFRVPWKKWTYPEDAPPPNNIIQHIKVFIDELWSCGYCTSVWVSSFITMFIVSNFYDWVVYTLIVHRLSNWWHVLFELLKHGRVRAYDLVVKLTEQVDE